MTGLLERKHVYMRKWFALFVLLLLITVVTAAAQADEARLPGGNTPVVGVWKAEDYLLCLQEDGDGCLKTKSGLYRFTWQWDGKVLQLDGDNLSERLLASSSQLATIFYGKKVTLTRAADFASNAGTWKTVNGAEPHSLELNADGHYSFFSDGQELFGGEWMDGGEWIFLFRAGNSTLQAEVGAEGLILTVKRTQYMLRRETPVSPAPTSTPAPENLCTSCGGARRVPYLCGHCRGSGGDTAKCSACNGVGRADCRTCKGGIIFCISCDGRGSYPCSSCGGDGRSSGYFADSSGRCTFCDGKGKYDCSRCKGERFRYCGDCNAQGRLTCASCKGKGKTNVYCKSCKGTGVSYGPCDVCDGVGTMATPKPTNPVHAAPLLKKSVRLSGAAWNAQSVDGGAEILKKFQRGTALLIEYTTSGSDGHVWICLPESKQGWTGIGQQSPMIRQEGSRRYVIIPFSEVFRAAGNAGTWGKKLYIKGNQQWTVMSVSVIPWTE